MKKSNYTSNYNFFMTDLPVLCEKRKEFFTDIVKDKRNKLFANNKLI